MKYWKRIVLSCAVVAGIGATALPLVATPVSALSVFQACSGQSATGACSTSSSASSMATTIINTMLYLIGIVAVIMIVVGGVRYTTSAGNASQVKGAKDTIMYAIIGLVIAIMAFAIVNFVVGKF